MSNCPKEVLSVLGIEAARMCLMHEITRVLDDGDIYVNHRHLSTLCDVMTRGGVLTSMTRHG
jgi:DNA-directed RNA polymerase II subunit RPB1